MNLDDSIDNYGLSNTELALLRKGNFLKVADLLLATPQDIAKRCKASPVDVKRIVDKLFNSVPQLKFERLDISLSREGDEFFTTGDEILDNALGGGIRTGMIWEIVGESAAGKTQFGLQLSLHVQATPALGGLLGAACYLLTSSKLPTARLLQISNARGLSTSGCSLDDVHTIAAPTIPVLQRVLTETLPTFIESKASQRGKPIKLVVIDALGELFHSNDKTSTTTLFQRSKDLTFISAKLHEIASKYRVALVVLNEVIDVFRRPSYADENQGDMLYEQQSTWFNTAEFFGEGNKEAALGLTWANQVNTRIMLSRTLRRKYLDDESHSKRQHLPDRDPGAGKLAKEPRQVEPMLIRRLSILFSSVSSPTALDYIVTESGISVIQEDAVPQPTKAAQAAAAIKPIQDQSQDPQIAQSAPDTTNKTLLFEGDEFDRFWDQDDTYDNFDWDALEVSLSQSMP